MDRGAWRATVHRVEKSRTLLSDFHFLSLQLKVAPSHKVLSGFIGILPIPRFVNNRFIDL